MQTAQIISLLLCALWLSCASPLLHAAEQDSKPTAEGSSQSSGSEQANKDKPAAANKKSNTKDSRGSDQEIFRPSEEISEDFAVSFPVDI